MTIIAVTGPRRLTEAETEEATPKLIPILKNKTLYVGDATGLDALAAELATTVKCFEKKLHLPYKVQGAERSTRMVKALAADGGSLHAFPNKPAPPDLKPAKSWPKNTLGSGTWGTIALTVGLGLEVELHPLIAIEIPDWLPVTQLARL